jgi:hypothetical protein
VGSFTGMRFIEAIPGSAVLDDMEDNGTNEDIRVCIECIMILIAIISNEK